MANVVLKNVYKFYEKNLKPAVSDFNLEIKDQEFVVFVGPSGCGKSTTLRMIAGLEHVTFGEIAIDGRVVNDVEPKSRDIAMVFQSYALYPHMTVYDNLAFGLKSAHTPVEQRDKSYIARNAKGKRIGGFRKTFGKTLTSFFESRQLLRAVCDRGGVVIGRVEFGSCHGAVDAAERGIRGRQHERFSFGSAEREGVVADGAS